MTNNTQEYEEGLRVAIDFLKTQIQEYCNPETLFRQKPNIFTVIVQGFEQYTDDIIKWLKDNYSFNEIAYILTSIENIPPIKMQEDSNITDYAEISDELFNKLMTENSFDMDGNESDSIEVLGEFTIEDESYNEINCPLYDQYCNYIN